MTVLIEAAVPGGWQNLESTVGQILSECGYDVALQKNVQLARGDVNIDVWADDHASPPNVIAVECKHWSTPVNKNVVHAFRAVVGDSGANTGLIVSSAGYQSGAVDAAAYSNVQLLGWAEFQTMVVDRWYRNHMVPRLYSEADPLMEYTEPVNSRISRKADALTSIRRDQFKKLRRRYFALGVGLVPMYMESLGKTMGPTMPSLPLRDTLADQLADQLPGSMLDAQALRSLLEAMTSEFRAAIAQFDEVFGERA